jgi:DNA polymerase IIIc chi subunit
MLTEKFAMYHVSTKFIPHNLIVEQNENQQNICMAVFQEVEADVNFIKLIITGDEKEPFQACSGKPLPFAGDET